MTPERYQFIKAIFFEASTVHDEAREAMLIKYCGNDRLLRQEIENLLAAREPDTAALNVSLEPTAAAAVEGAIERLQREAPTSGCNPMVSRSSSDPDQPPQIVGFTIERIIGSGGMGTVYAATQHKPRRTVAIKVMRPNIASRSALRRFEYEAQVLAQLRHPGIAQIYEAGTANAGLGTCPYFAMELLQDAKPITVYAEEKKLGTRQRFKLMAQVCDAVHHAHQKGVIHRDLKPANILVDATGQPKILDFGIAKATDQDIQVTTMHTDIGQLIGTLAYMSPEQVAADPAELDIRSDVYALGVVLFELLAACLPYDLKMKAIHEAARVICEEEPTPLSTINRVFRGDIETIVQKAMEKDKARRYQSSAELASDIERYLNNEPITAHPPSRIYQLRKFAQRNRVLVGGVCAVFLALAAGTAVSTWQAIRARSAERVAKTEAVRADQTSAFIQTIFEGINPYQAQGMETGLLMHLLSKAEGRISKELADQPLAEAAIRYTLGKAYMDLDRLDEADQNLGRSEQLYVRHLGNHHELTARAHTEQVRLLLRRGKHQEAHSLALLYIPNFEQSLGKDATETLEMCEALGHSLVVMRRDIEAEKIQRDVLERRVRVSGEQSSETAEAMEKLGFTLNDMGRYDEAARLIEKAIDVYLVEFGLDHYRTLLAKSQLANARSDQGRFEEAFALYETAISGLIPLLGPRNSQTLNVMNNWGGALLDAGRHSEAEEIHRRTYEARREVFGETHVATLLSQNNLAKSLRAQLRFQEAEDMFRNVLEARKQSLGDDHGDTLSTKYDLAELLASRGRDAESAALFSERVASYRRLNLDKQAIFVIALYNWAAKLQDSGDHEAALPIFQEVLVNQAILSARDKPVIPMTHNAMAKCMEAAGDTKGADVHFLKGMELRRQSGRSNSHLVFSLNDYGIALMNRGDYASAETYLREYLQIAEALNPPDPVRWATAKALWGWCQTRQGRFEEAEAALIAANEAVSRSNDFRNDVLKEICKRFVELYEAWEAVEPNTGKVQEAAKWREKLQA